MLLIMGTGHAWAGSFAGSYVPQSIVEGINFSPDMPGTSFSKNMTLTSGVGGAPQVSAECCSQSLQAVSGGVSPCSLDKLMVHTQASPFFPGRARLTATHKTVPAGFESSSFIFRPPIV